MIFLLIKIKAVENKIQQVQIAQHHCLEYVLCGEYRKDLEQQITTFIEKYKEGVSCEIPSCDLKEVPLFSRQVLKALTQIPFGQTMTYGECAHLLGHPKAARAVGGACRRNPIPFFIPCHRLIGQKDLGGFSQGLPLKEKLLSFETHLSFNP